MLTIKQLWVYPIKSCQGVSLEHLECLPSGLRHDREMMIIDENGRFVTQRSDSILAQISVKLPSDNQVELNFSGQTCRFAKQYQHVVSAEVWRRQVPGFDQGNEIASYLSEVIRRRVRLIATRPVDTQAAEKSILFQDGQAMHVLTEASLAHAKQHLPNLQIDSRRFRPNTVIGDSEQTPVDEKITAFAEDNLKIIQTNSTTFSINKLCERCNIPSINPDTLTSDKAVHSYFKTHRIINKRPVFGVCGSIVKEGKINIGDNISVSD